jgi:hypothetical protein
VDARRSAPTGECTNIELQRHHRKLSTAANWSSGIPATGYTAALAASSASYTVTLDQSYSSPGLGTLTIDGGERVMLGGTLVQYTTTLSQTQNVSMYASSETIGNTGQGFAVYNQSAGTNTIPINFILGSSAGSTGTFTNNGVYNSDPATNYFATLSVGPTGSLLGGQGDQFVLSGDFLNSSRQDALWNTANAQIELTGGRLHAFEVDGADRGASGLGYQNNFSWGTLTLDAGDQLDLAGSGALYVRILDLAGGVGQIGLIEGNGLNIYYDPAQPLNAYLNGMTYSLSGGGSLVPVPDPGGIAILSLVPWLTRRIRRA